MSTLNVGARTPSPPIQSRMLHREPARSPSWVPFSSTSSRNKLKSVLALGTAVDAVSNTRRICSCPSTRRCRLLCCGNEVTAVATVQDPSRGPVLLLTSCRNWKPDGLRSWSPEACEEQPTRTGGRLRPRLSGLHPRLSGLPLGLLAHGGVA